jgi:pilus assembly protein CpaE
MGEIKPLVLDRTNADLNVTIVLAPDVAELLDMSRLKLPGISLALHAGTLDSFLADPVRPQITDVLVLQSDPTSASEFAAVTSFAARMAGHMPVVLAVRDLTVPLTRRLLRTDIADVVPLPFTPEELAQAIETAHQSRARPAPPVAAAPVAPRQRGRVISLLGALGGVGTTSLAAQLGVLWAADKRVVLIDLDVQFGNAALYLNLRPRLTLAELIDAGDRMDSAYLASVAERHQSGLEVIAAPSDIIPLDTLTPAHVEHLLQLAAETWDIVLVDLPDAWINWSAAALTRSDHILLISEVSVAGVHQAKRQLEMIDANGLGDRLHLVMNRVTGTLFRKADMAPTEQALKRKVGFVISNDYAAMSAAIDEGRPISSIKVKSRVEKDLRTLMEAVEAMPANAS